jgi:hypothetical protein
MRSVPKRTEAFDERHSEEFVIIDDRDQEIFLTHSVLLRDLAAHSDESATESDRFLHTAGRRRAYTRALCAPGYHRLVLTASAIRRGPPGSARPFCE